MKLISPSSRLSVVICVAALLAAAPLARSQAVPKTTAIYVADFELDSENFQAASGPGTGPVAERPKVRPGVVVKKQEDPAKQAQHTVELMSKSIVNDLKKTGYNAKHLASGTTRPTEGYLLSGVFTEVDEGNRMRRAMIGFGTGDAKIDLYVNIANLAHPDKPLYTSADDKTSGKMPGAIITMNPYVAAAKFVISKQAPDKTVKKTASDISADVVKFLQNPSSPDSGFVKQSAEKAQ